MMGLCDDCRDLHHGIPVDLQQNRPNLCMFLIRLDFACRHGIDNTVPEAAMTLDGFKFLHLKLRVFQQD